MSKQQKSGCSGCFKYLFFFVLAIFVCIAVASDDDGSGSGTISKGDDIIIPVDQSLSGFYYDQLDGTEQLIYETMLQRVQDGELTYTFENVDYNAYAEAVPRALSAITYDHPEYFWLKDGYSYRGNGSGIEVSMICYDYWSYTMSPKNYVELVRGEVERIASKARQYTEPYEQVKYVHDYLIQTAEYDHDTLAEAQKTIHTASSEYIYSAYGCLVNKKTVCAGYAKAFQMILYELGIPCAYVVGDAGGPHAWNLVELGGANYFVDVTWDDGDWKDEDGSFKYLNDAEYNYFCLTDTALGKTHTADEVKFDIPACMATLYNYYEYYGFKVNTYDLNQVAAVFDRQSDQQIAAVQFGSLAELNRAKEELFDAGKWESISSLAGRRFNYGWNEDHYVLTIYK